MIHQHILTFLQVAERKSFSAAAEKLYLTPNAVKKRIEALEHETGLCLFQRTNQGCTLTSAGKSLYRDLIEINKLYSAAIANATYAQRHARDVLFVGIMSTFAESFMSNTWHNVRQRLRGRQLQINYYGASLSDMDEMFRKVGTATTMCVDIYDEELAKKYGLAVRKISTFPFYAGVPCSIMQPGTSELPMEIFSEYSVAVLSAGRSKVFDMIREELQQKVPDVRIETIEEYSIRSMNDCSMKRQFVLLAQNQTALYPFFTFFPFDTAHKIDFGIYYKKNDEDLLADFFRIIEADDSCCR